MDPGDRTQRVEEVREASAGGVQTDRGPGLLRTLEEPRIVLDLLGQVGVLPDGVDDDRVLLSLPLKEVASGHLGEAKHVGEVCVLISCELRDMALGDLSQGELLLHLFLVLRPLSLPGLVQALAPLLFLLGAQSLDLGRLVLVFPVPLDKVRQFSELELLEFAYL